MTEIKVVVHSIHFDADDKLIEFVQGKINKLSNLYDHIIEGEVFLKLENVSILENKVVEIKLLIPKNDLFAKKSGKTFEEATDLAVEAIKRQVIKKKEKGSPKGLNYLTKDDERPTGRSFFII